MADEAREKSWTLISKGWEAPERKASSFAIAGGALLFASYAVWVLVEYPSPQRALIFVIILGTILMYPFFYFDSWCEVRLSNNAIEIKRRGIAAVEVPFDRISLVKSGWPFVFVVFQDDANRRRKVKFYPRDGRVMSLLEQALSNPPNGSMGQPPAPNQTTS